MHVVFISYPVQYNYSESGFTQTPYTVILYRKTSKNVWTHITDQSKSESE